jgi:sulfur carrier protein
MAPLMQITVNDDQVELSGPVTVAQLLERYELQHRACAVEVNQQLVTKIEHESHMLGDGDVVQLVTLVGGG